MWVSPGATAADKLLRTSNGFIDLAQIWNWDRVLVNRIFWIWFQFKIFDLFYAFSSTDIDECMTGADDCDTNAECTDTEGGFNCTCNEGYTGNGTSCSGKCFIHWHIVWAKFRVMGELPLLGGTGMCLPPDPYFQGALPPPPPPPPFWRPTFFTLCQFPCRQFSIKKKFNRKKSHLQDSFGLWLNSTQLMVWSVSSYNME